MSTANFDITTTIEQARTGDTGAFAQIVRQYQSLVSGVLFSATGDFHKSEDFTQETFLIAWQKLGELRETDHLAAWLCTIARNLVHRSHRKSSIVTEPLTEGTGGLTPTAHAPDAELLRQEQSDFVWSAIGEIDEKYRETLVLYYRGGQSVREIASATESTEEAVRQRLVRARKSLKAKLEEMVGTILTDTAPGEAFTLTVMTALGAAMLTATTAQAAVATGTVATGTATSGKALGTAAIGSVLMPVAFYGWFIAIFAGVFWANVRNAPTLRARRCKVYSIFWGLQYYGLFCVAFTIVMSISMHLLFPLFTSASFALMLCFSMVATSLLAFSIMIPIQEAQQRKMKGIIENDLGLPGEHVESYSHPQVERRFFLSLITNLLLAETFIAFVVVATLSDGSWRDPTFFPGMSIGIIFVAGLTTLYYSLGRYFLKICGTKQDFLSAPPLIDNPFEATLRMTWKHPASVDHPEKVKGMSGLVQAVKIGYIFFGIWYFSFYSWDKHPIALGICAALIVTAVCMVSPLFKSHRRIATIVLPLCIVGLMLVMEYIEFGDVYCLSMWFRLADPLPMPSSVCGMHLGGLVMGTCFFIGSWLRSFKTKRKANDDKSSGREELLREAIARFEPAMSIADEPMVEPQPFPRHWLWILVLYAVAIVVMGCVGVMVL